MESKTGAQYRVRYIGDHRVSVLGLGAFSPKDEKGATEAQAQELFRAARAKVKRNLPPDFQVFANLGKGWYGWKVSVERPWEITVSVEGLHGPVAPAKDAKKDKE